jgi:hypothetical protein
VLKERLKKDFIKRFESVSCGRRSRYDVFQDWAECAAIAAYNTPVTLGVLPPNDTYHAFEKRYLEIAANYKKDELTAFAQMFGIVQYALGLAKTDFLGQLYEELEIGGKRTKGEFFTPFPVAKVTARVTFDEQHVKSLIEEKGYITFYEPCVGAGSMLIAASLVLEELGHDPRQHMVFTAVDINKLFCHMTFIQAASLGLTGWVSHGNSLSQEMWEQWATPQLQVAIRQDEMTPAAKLQAVFEEFAAAPEGGKPESVEPEPMPNFHLQEKAEEETISVEADFTPRQLTLFGDWQGELSNE